MRDLDFEAYKAWVRVQTCCDCGALASERSKEKPWVTETQCFECFCKYGCPEKRGLPSANDIARSAGVTPNVELTGSRAGLLPVSPATEGSEVERRVGGAP